MAVISPDVQDSDGRTALHWAAYNGMNELLALLITAGIMVLCNGYYGDTCVCV